MKKIFISALVCILSFAANSQTHSFKHMGVKWVTFDFLESMGFRIYYAPDMVTASTKKEKPIKRKYPKKKKAKIVTIYKDEYDPFNDTVYLARLMHRAKSYYSHTSEPIVTMEQPSVRVHNSYYLMQFLTLNFINNYSLKNPEPVVINETKQGLSIYHENGDLIGEMRQQYFIPTKIGMGIKRETMLFLRQPAELDKYLRLRYGEYYKGILTTVEF